MSHGIQSAAHLNNRIANTSFIIPFTKKLDVLLSAGSIGGWGRRKVLKYR